MVSNPIPDTSEAHMTVTAGSCPTLDPLTPICRRLEHLEKELPEIKKRLVNLVEHREKQLKDKFRIHDRAVMLSNQFEDWRNRAGDIPGKVQVDVKGYYGEWNLMEEELRTLVKSLVELVDVALEL